MSKKCGRKKKIDKAVDDGKSGADEWIYHARVLQTSHYLIPIVGVKYTQ